MEIRCSKLSRPMTCAGSLFFEVNDPPEGDPAREGTAAGELLAKLLLRQVIGTHASNGVPFDEEMKFYIPPIAEMIQNEAQSEILCETRIDWETRSGIRIRGSYDMSYTIDEGRTLCIDDLKFGWGLVEVPKNWQLLGYGIGEVIRRGQAFEKIRFRIIQPRPHHEDGYIREWWVTYPELLDIKEQIEKRMDEIVAGDKSCVTSKNCKYCPAAAVCPALNKAYYRGVEVVHEFCQDEMSNEELAFQLEQMGRIAELLKIRQDSIKDLAIAKMQAGELIPGWGKDFSYGDRKWKDCVSPDVVQSMTGRNIMKQEMLSPAQAEKLGVPKEFVNAMTDRKQLAPRLVRKDHDDLGTKIFGRVPKGE